MARIQIRSLPGRATIVLTAFIFAMLLAFLRKSNVANQNESSNTEQRLSFEGIVALLDLCDTLAIYNPQAEAIRNDLLKLDAGTRKEKLNKLSETNEENHAIAAATDRLLNSEPYSLYYRQFRNVTPETHRQIILRLPYGANPSPADISSTLLELFDHRIEARAMLTTLRQLVDLGSASQIAKKWLPARKYQDPEVYFIYDGNGDAFASSDGIVFDLFGVLLSRRPEENRFVALDGYDAQILVETVAHELHHYYAGQCFDQNYDDPFDRLTFRFAKEGLAMQCNPPTGLRKETKEDTAIVLSWAKQLQQHRAALNNGTLDVNGFQRWVDSSYQDLAIERLRVYLSRSYSGEEVERQVRMHSGDRPAMVYTLGWWMVRTISEKGNDPAAAIRLVTAPDSIYSWYNARVQKIMPEMVFDFK